MNISFNWLKDYVDPEMSATQTADVLTSLGLETGSVEEMESIRGGLKGLVIGRVLTCEDHPDSDHLHVTTVDLGTGDPVRIVCGAPNVAAGQTVVVATVGTTLYDGDKSFQIKKSKIRGVESFGMICAEDEIGTGTSHDGIIVIEDREVAPGTPAAQYYKLESDYVLEVDLTPNRIDAASHYGVARDLAAWSALHANHARLHRPSVSDFASDRPDGAVTVEVQAPQACTRYSGVTIRGVRVAESPEWLRRRLSTIGLRPINNIVDITNYILHAIGQPLHCFDLSKISDQHIVVRTTPEGTPFVTLDGVERKLSESDLMICDSQRPMCMAGVFGGLDSGVTEQTTDIFIESACFNPTSVRRTARRHGLSTDSSFRYERGVDPNGTLYALKLAALMVKQLAGGEICGEPVDIYPTVVNRAEVVMRYDDIDRLTGKHIEHETVDRILQALEIEIAERMDNGVLKLLIPTYRVDVTRPCDVIEDILRIYGYNNVETPVRVSASLSQRTAVDQSNDLRETLSDLLAAIGFNEILNNSLTAESYYEDNAEWPVEQCVRLLNPLSNDLSVMRRTLLYGGLESIAHNVNRRSSDLLMFEFGNVYSRNPELQPTADAPLAPYHEHSRLSLWMTGNMRAANWDKPAEQATFFELKAVMANLLAKTGISPRETKTEAGSRPIFSDSLELRTRSGKWIASMGLLAQATLRKFDIKQPVAYSEIDWDALASLASRRNVTFAPLPRTQAVKRDLALLIDSATTFADVEAVIRDTEKKLLRAVRLFDVYEGRNLAAGKKSYAVSIELQDDERTLTDQQIDNTMNRIIKALNQRLGAELR